MKRYFQRMALLGLVMSGCASSKIPVSAARFVPPSAPVAPPESTAGMPAAETPAVISTEPAIDPNLKKIQELMDRASLMFDEGERLLRQGRTKEAKQRLRDSTEMVKNSPFSMPQYPFLQRFYLNLKSEAAALENSLIEEQERGIGGSEDKHEQPQVLEPAAVDALRSINLYQITVDPALISMVSEDVKKMRFTIPIALNDRVFRMLEYYQNRSRDWMERGLAQSGKYMPLFHRIFEEEKVPLELAYAAQVESMYKPLAYSRAHAKGIWQFTRAAAQDYALKVTPWVDERSDVEKSTRAAARYLKELYRRFGDWQIALGAYNCGPARFERILARYGDISYWEMAEKGVIPTETINHVPSVLATIIIASNPERYGFLVKYSKPLEFERFSVRRSIRLSDIAEACNVPLDTLKELNPDLTRMVTPRDDPDYQLKLPLGASLELEARIAQLPETPVIPPRRYRVRSGDTWATVARRTGISVRRLHSLNPRVMLRRGQTLTLRAASIQESSRPARAAGARLPERQRIIHRVSPGETVGSIASRYSTDIKSIRKWNHSTASLRPGRRLTIYLPK